MSNRSDNSLSKNKTLIIVGIVLIVIAMVFTYLAVVNKAKSDINSYSECVAAGYPIRESFPEVCAVPGGKSFTNN